MGGRAVDTFTRPPIASFRPFLCSVFVLYLPCICILFVFRSNLYCIDICLALVLWWNSFKCICIDCQLWLLPLPAWARKDWPGRDRQLWRLFLTPHHFYRICSCVLLMVCFYCFGICDIQGHLYPCTISHVTPIYMEKQGIRQKLEISGIYDTNQEFGFTCWWAFVQQRSPPPRCLVLARLLTWLIRATRGHGRALEPVCVCC